MTKKNQPTPAVKAVAPPPAVPPAAPPASDQAPPEDKPPVGVQPAPAPSLAAQLRERHRLAGERHAENVQEQAEKLWDEEVLPTLEKAADDQQLSIMWSSRGIVSTDVKQALVEIAKSHKFAATWTNTGTLLVNFSEDLDLTEDAP